MSGQPLALARIDHLTVTFAGRTTPAVDAVSLTVRAGECVALVGESGSGKSLTAKALLGLLPDTALVTGSVILAEQEAPARGSAEWNAIRGAKIALIPQDALGGLDPLRRIEHEVGDALRLHRLANGTERRLQVITALESAGMPDAEHQLRRRSDELSGGLRQRALIASALIAEPTLIVADEPTTALDASHRSRVLAALRSRVEAGAGALLISHDLNSVRSVADRVFVMRDGRIVEHGAPNVVLTTPQHTFTRELIDASPIGKTRVRRTLGQTSAAPRLELRSIEAGFGANSRADKVLQDASLQVHPGETVGLVGESGSGKTTLLRIALGLHTQNAGQVLIDGIDRGSADRNQRRELRRRIALVPQDPLDSFPPSKSAAAILADALRAAGVPHNDRNSEAITLAAEVGLETQLLTRPAATLSGGQRQRLAIARALARKPELLLLDEPVSALDLTVQARVLDLLHEVQQRRGTAYLFVSHDDDVITYMSDRVLRLEAGRLRAE